MAITFPRTDIYDPELFDAIDFAAMDRQEFSRSANGVTYGKDFGEVLWQLSFSTRPLLSSDALAYEARLRSLRGVTGRFFAGDPRRCNPRMHRTGAFSDTGTIHTVGDNNKSLRIVCPSAGFVISEGDYLAFQYGSTPSYVLHQALETVTADGSALTPLFEVFPHIRPGLTIGSPAPAVVLKKPQALFALEPGSVSRRRVAGPWWSVSFSAVQVIE